MQDDSGGEPAFHQGHYGRPSAHVHVIGLLRSGLDPAELAKQGMLF
jgi:hypothetical protein